MPRYICKTIVNGVEYFLEWSTIVDAPVTYGMSRKDFESYCVNKYGAGILEKHLADGKSVFDRRMEIVDAFGTSARCSFEELVEFNRAGKNESSIRPRTIIKRWVINPQKGIYP